MKSVFVLFGTSMLSLFVGHETRSTLRCQELIGGTAGRRGRRSALPIETIPRNSDAGTASGWWDRRCGGAITGITVRSVCTRGMLMGGRRVTGPARAVGRWRRLGCL